MARPKREFSKEEVDKITEMSADNCHMDTIALALDIPLETLRRHFGGFIRQKRAEGRANLHHWQNSSAEDGNVTMQIWRGKQLLGQADKHEQTGDTTMTIKHIVVDKAKDGTDD